MRRIAEGKPGMGRRVWHGLLVESVFSPRTSVLLRASAWSFSFQDPSQGYLSIPPILKSIHIKGSFEIP